MPDNSSAPTRSPQPNSRLCFVCGLSNPYGLHLRFYENASGEVTADYVVPERFQGYPGVVHGGVVAAMLDEAAGRTMMGGYPPRFMFTARMDIRYRQNVPVGKPLRLVGRVGKNKTRSATATSEIYDQDGNLLAQADLLLINIPEDIVVGVDLEKLGWKVYEEGSEAVNLPPSP